MPLTCNICQESLSPDNNFCPNCGYSTEMSSENRKVAKDIWAEYHKLKLAHQLEKELRYNRGPYPRYNHEKSLIENYVAVYLDALKEVHQGRHSRVISYMENEHRFGLVDPASGKVILNSEFEGINWAHENSHNYIAVKKVKEGWYIINHQQEKLSDIYWDIWFDPSFEDLAVVKTKYEGGFKVLDIKNNCFIDKEIHFTDGKIPFIEGSEGWEEYQRNKEKEKELLNIDYESQFIILTSPEDKKAIFKKKQDGLYALFDENFDQLTKYKYEAIGYPLDHQKNFFSEKAIGAKKDGKWGYVNKFGNEISEFIYDRVEPFSSNLGAVRANQIYTLINKTGKEVLPMIFRRLGVINGTVYKGFIFNSNPTTGRGKLVSVSFPKYLLKLYFEHLDKVEDGFLRGEID